MDTYESRPLISMPVSKPLREMTDGELAKLLASSCNYNVLIPTLIESNRRKDQEIADLKYRISNLESRALKKAGRPKTCFYINGKELTDDMLIYYIDYDFFTISELEKEVGAGKNQLRNRYKKAKQKQRIQREVDHHGDC